MRPNRLLCVLVAAAFAISACTTDGPSPAPTATAPASPHGIASSSPAGPSAPPASAFGEWTRVDMPDAAPGVYGGGTPSGLVAFDGGYVAVGTVHADCCDGGDPSSRRGIVWTSADGRSWRLHEPVPAFAHATLGDLLVDGTRLFAVGSFAAANGNGNEPGESIPAIWVSDDGETWVRTAGTAPSLVAVGPSGLVGAVIDGPLGARTVQFASSQDGLAWTSTSGVFTADVRAIAVSADGTALAIGAVDGPPRGDGSPTTDLVFWRSADGSAWTGPEVPVRAAMPIALAGVGVDFLAIVDVESQLANGSIDSAPELWLFTAGTAQVFASIPIGDEDNLSAMFVVGDALVVAGDTTVNDTADAIVWVSTDGGATWGRVAEQAAFAGLDDAIGGAVASPDGLVAVGSRWDGATSHPLPEAWIAAR